VKMKGGPLRSGNPSIRIDGPEALGYSDPSHWKRFFIISSNLEYNCHMNDEIASSILTVLVSSISIAVYKEITFRIFGFERMPLGNV